MRSVLMDVETLLRFRELWVPDVEPVSVRTERLGAGERAALELLHTEGGVRLEQERVPWEYAWGDAAARVGMIGRPCRCGSFWGSCNPSRHYPPPAVDAGLRPMSRYFAGIVGASWNWPLRAGGGGHVGEPRWTQELERATVGMSAMMHVDRTLSLRATSCGISGLGAAEQRLGCCRTAALGLQNSGLRGVMVL
ncbi:Wadjet anti-phage system protein JetD domain-containing protein [Myceligenerans indicum]|uniref:Wadjet anti-phage system protein JetD domain-containing protein n=1 Tax=Myceligenerans indicum TaxID=2593663 RepID=UPI003557F2B2